MKLFINKFTHIVCQAPHKRRARCDRTACPFLYRAKTDNHTKTIVPHVQYIIIFPFILKAFLKPRRLMSMTCKDITYTRLSDIYHIRCAYLRDNEPIFRTHRDNQCSA